MIRALERDIFTPLLSKAQVISFVAEDIVDFIVHQIDAHEMLDNIVAIIRSSLAAVKRWAALTTATSLINSYGDVLLNVVMADYQRLVNRKRKDSCDVKRMLFFRAEVLTRKARCVV